jgi:hypothetical protein
MMPCDWFAYMTGCDDEPVGNEDARFERATCIMSAVGVVEDGSG